MADAALVRADVDAAGPVLLVLDFQDAQLAGRQRLVSFRTGAAKVVAVTFGAGDAKLEVVHPPPSGVSC